LQLATECEQLNIGALDVPLASKWLTIYYGNSYIPDRDLRTIHFCFPTPALARVSSKLKNNDTNFLLYFVFQGMDRTIISLWT
jgi:hypothetical protein